MPDGNEGSRKYERKTNKTRVKRRLGDKSALGRMTQQTDMPRSQTEKQKLLHTLQKKRNPEHEKVCGRTSYIQPGGQVTQPQ